MKQKVLVLPILLFLCSCNGVNEQKAKAPTRVKTEIASVVSGHDEQTYVGMIEECEGTAVSFTSMGLIKRMLVNEGQSVTKGQLLAEMDDTQARNLLQGAEAQMAQANDAYKRYKMLHDNGSLPEVQWMEIQSKVAQAKSQWEVGKKNLADCRLIAPVNGIVGKKMLGIGETALPSQTVVSILDINTVKVKVSIPESEISSINANTQTIIQVEAIGDSFQGGCIEKGIQADALTHTYDIRILVENKERKLLPGMVASVTISTSKTPHQGYIMLPITSVQKNANGSLFVWIIDQENKVHRATVSVGHTQGNRIAIVGGLDVNQRIVTEGYQKLSEGTTVVY